MEIKYEEINPEYVYLTIPADWVCIYHKLLVCMSDLGKDILDDCDSGCKGTNKIIINCWNIFQSAIACRELGETEKAEFFINFIKKQLKHIYKGKDDTEYEGSFPITITDDGRLKAVVSCNTDDSKFEVDVETGELYREWQKSKNDYEVINDNLIVSK